MKLRYLKTFASKKFKGQILVQRIVWSKNNLGLKNMRSKKNVGKFDKKIQGPENFCSKKMYGPKSGGKKKKFPKKNPQNGLHLFHAVSFLFKDFPI